jgi:UDP-N-acetylmuramoyl-L-alanyl-D-glutamate--2,6-diaminopimelate ligase
MGVRTLAELLRAAPEARLVQGAPDLPISGITHDSRAVLPGAVFVALRGRTHDGLAFVADARRRGAVAVVSERPTPLDAGAWVVVPHARAALADLAAAWYGYPAARLRVVGVTGTDGKTTTTRLIATLLEAGGRRSGWHTTADLKLGAAVIANIECHTTPEADRVQALLAALVRAGAEFAVLEASSHALAQDRLRGCWFDVGVLTNLSAEHLDYHGSLEAYREAKARLFVALGLPHEKVGPRYAVLNADDPSFAQFRARCTVPVVTYSLHGPADVWAPQVVETPEGLRLEIRAGGEVWPLATRFLGRHNAANWLAAVAVALQEGVPPAAIQAAARTARPAPGRLQPVRCGQPFQVYVDYAHTPQALRAVLAAVRVLRPRRVLLALSHGGGRTPSNRPALGAVAAAAADYFVITSDDAYPEDPGAIAAAIERGARAGGARPGERYVVCLDRRQAIRHLLGQAEPGDVVLLTGKGHETYLRRDGVVQPWSEVEVAREALAELGYSEPDGAE